MENLIFRILLFLGMAACAVIRYPYIKKYKKNVNIKTVNEKSEKVKVFIAWLGMGLVPLLYIITPLFNRFDVYVPISVRTIAAVLFLLNNFIFFYYIHKQLDNNWSMGLDIREGHTLITGGIYKYIRHPMYTQCWIFVLLQGIVAANIFVTVFGIAAWGILYFTRVFDEEKMMIEKFGNRYKNYMRFTGRILPKLF